MSVILYNYYAGQMTNTGFVRKILFYEMAMSVTLEKFKFMSPISTIVLNYLMIMKLGPNMIMRLMIITFQ